MPPSLSEFYKKDSSYSTGVIGAVIIIGSVHCAMCIVYIVQCCVCIPFSLLSLQLLFSRSTGTLLDELLVEKNPLWYLCACPLQTFERWRDPRYVHF
jgi:hypothetical protein